MEDQALLATINALEHRIMMLEVASSSGEWGASENTSSVAIPMLAGSPNPWTFECSISEDQGGQEVRTGGWTNCILQLGYNYFLTSPDVISARAGAANVNTISGTDLTADGEYVCEVNIASKTAAIMLKASATHTYPIDFENNIVYVDIGTVTSGVQVSGIPNHPVIYTYQ